MFQVVANKKSSGNHIPVFCVKIVSDQCYWLQEKEGGVAFLE